MDHVPFPAKPGNSTVPGCCDFKWPAPIKLLKKGILEAKASAEKALGR